MSRQHITKLEKLIRAYQSTLREEIMEAFPEGSEWDVIHSSRQVNPTRMIVYGEHQWSAKDGLVHMRIPGKLCRFSGKEKLSNMRVHWSKLTPVKSAKKEGGQA